MLGSSSPKRRARSLSLVGGAVLVPSLIAAGCSGPVDNWDDLLPRQVRISEIHYHDPTRAAREFVEISNSGPGDVVLSNWCIEGAGFCFEGRISIGDGERIVVDAEQMEGSLRDSGEELRLVDGSGTVRDVVSYLDDEPWPAEADGLGYSLQLDCRGDLEVDEHHTVEDCAIALGEALRQALGDKRGIARYGFLLPMDEARVQVAIDLSGRAYPIFEGKFSRDQVGGLPTELVPHFFRSLADSLGAALHVSVTGENTHHQVEACFKGVGRALRMALRREGAELPTTKGVL